MRHKKGTFGCPFFCLNFDDFAPDSSFMRVVFSILPSLALLASALYAPPAQAQYVTAREDPSAFGGELSQERMEALELRLSRMEQLLNAQRTLQARQNKNEAMKLRQRLESIEARLTQGFAPTNTGRAGAPATQVANTPAFAGDDLGIGVQTRLNDVTESLRLLQAQIDQLLSEMRAVTQRVELGHADNEFRFQALESGVRRATAGISSVSDEPEVIGFVKRSAPIESMESASAAAATKLVGEGDLSALTGFERSRTPLSDPTKLYQRALQDLQSGNYNGAEADFAQLVQGFPSHKLAGNAQYWLGETYYVRRQFKQAAQAFLVGYTTYAESKKAPDSLLKLGMTLTALGEKKTGCDAFAELGAKFPDAPDAVSKRAQIERKRAGCAS
jgi:tol-pal system protein YbgF